MPTVLVVDDSAVDRRLVGGLLEKDADLTVDYAIHGAEALAKMGSAPPDLVVTDHGRAGTGTSYVVFTEGINESDLVAQATLIPAGGMKGIGDINLDGFDDLIASTTEASPTLDESAQVNHGVLHVFLGGEDAHAGNNEVFRKHDFVFERERPTYAAVGSPINPDPLLYREAVRRRWPVRFFEPPGDSS